MKNQFSDRLRNVEGIVWDLDNTLYRINEIMALAFHRAVAQAVIEAGVPYDLETATAMAQKSFAQYGFSGKVFVLQHGVDETWLHHKFHQNIDEAVIEGSAELVMLFRKTELRHALITHGSADWARRVLTRLGLKEFFPEDRILGFEDYGFQKKSESAASFVAAIERLGIDPSKLLFVEDTASNLAIPYDLEMGTVLLHYGQRPKQLPPYVQADYDNALDLMQHVLQQKRTPTPASQPVLSN